MPTAAITQNKQHVANGVALLITQFKEKPRMTALLAAFLNEGQQVENALYGLLAMQLPTATGAALDLIGKIVGQTRQGMLDAQYVQFIQARIRTNLSDGKVETLIAITLLLVGLSTPVLFREYLKAVEIECDNVTVNAYVVWSQFLNVAKDAGTKLNFIFSNAASSLTLKTISAYGGVSYIGTQQVDTAYDPTVIGGRLAGVFG